MTISYDTVTNGGSTTGTSLTYSHTCTGSNRALLVNVAAGSTDLITGVTYNGVSMTRIGATSTGGTGYEYLYGLIGPATGPNSIVVSASASEFIEAVSASYAGVGAFETGAVNTAINATLLTLTVTTSVANCWLVGGFSNSFSAASAGAGTTLRFSGGSGLAIGDSNAALAQGSQSLVATLGSSTGDWAGVVVAMEPFGTTASQAMSNVTGASLATRF